MDYALIWAGVISFAILAYVILDGFDLGIGILLPFERNHDHRDVMINTVAPVWDGNETWLILGGGGLLAAFPLAYALLLTAFYPLIMAMLIGLVFRGVAFEFRFISVNNKPWWDRGFVAGSYVAAFSQGMMVGTFIQGIDVSGRVYGGGWFDWLTPFSLFTGSAVVAGYALLGATWLVWKTEKDLQAWCRRAALKVGIATVAAMAVISVWTPLMDARIAALWFSMPNLLFLAPVPLLAGICAVMLWYSVRKGWEGVPFLAALGLFVTSFMGLAISVFPYAVPYTFSFRDAAAPDSALQFILVGAVVLLPMILGYTAWSYWVFRGKVKVGEGYH